jgi:hypothetical protein
MNEIMDENEENEEINPIHFIFHPSFNLAKSNKKKLYTSCHLRKWIVNEGE